MRHWTDSVFEHYLFIYKCTAKDTTVANMLLRARLEKILQLPAPLSEQLCDRAMWLGWWVSVCVSGHPQQVVA